jgi:hypothetical protein
LYGPEGKNDDNGGLGDVAQATVRGQAARKVTCEDCFFGANGLCSLGQTGPCPTFRPNRPEGLRPPRQLRFDFRQRTQSAWAFPTAQQQAALHT